MLQRQSSEDIVIYIRRAIIKLIGGMGDGLTVKCLYAQREVDEEDVEPKLPCSIVSINFTLP